MLLRTLGHCGSKPPEGPLPILVGEPADMCPTAAMLGDPELMALMDQVPSAFGPGSLSTIPRHELPAHLRELIVEADGWLAEWRGREAANG